MASHNRSSITIRADAPAVYWPAETGLGRMGRSVTLIVAWTRSNARIELPAKVTVISQTHEKRSKMWRSKDGSDGRHIASSAHMVNMGYFGIIDL